MQGVGTVQERHDPTSAAARAHYFRRRLIAPKLVKIKCRYR